MTQRTVQLLAAMSLILLAVLTVGVGFFWTQVAEAQQADPQCEALVDSANTVSVRNHFTTKNYSDGLAFKVDLSQDSEYMFMVTTTAREGHFWLARVCTPDRREVPGSFASGNVPGGGGYHILHTTASGLHYIQVGGSKEDGSFGFRVRQLQLDDCKASIETTCEAEANGIVDGKATHFYDTDWHSVELRSGRRYRIDLLGASTNSGRMSYPHIISIRNSSGTKIGHIGDLDSGLDQNARVEHVPNYTGTHYIVVGHVGEWEAFDQTYKLEVTLRPVGALPYDDCAEDMTTTCALVIGEWLTGEINMHPTFVRPKIFGRKGDKDWYAMDLEADVEYQIDMRTVRGRIGMKDSFIIGVYTSAGDKIAGTTNDNAVWYRENARVRIEPEADGRYYVAVRSKPHSFLRYWSNGLFRLRVKELVS